MSTDITEDIPPRNPADALTADSGADTSDLAAQLAAKSTEVESLQSELKERDQQIDR